MKNINEEIKESQRDGQEVKEKDCFAFLFEKCAVQGGCLVQQ